MLLAMGACDEKGEGGKAMAMGIRVVGDEEGERDEAGDGVGDEGPNHSLDFLNIRRPSNCTSISV